jgi:RNA processing factor Prp31
MEYILGPVLAVALSIKFTAEKSKVMEKRIAALEANIELMESSSTTMQSEMPKRMLATIVPLAQAVKKLNEQVGI